MKNNFILSLFALLMLSPFFSQGQNAGPQPALYKSLSNNFRVPVEMGSCKTFAGAVIVHIKQNVIDTNLVYSAYFPEVLKAEIKRCMKKLQTADFTKQYFGLSPKGSYSFLLPIIIMPFISCTQQSVSAKELTTLIGEAFDIEIKTPVYTLKAIAASTGERRP